MTAAQAARIKEQARALGVARTGRVGADPVTVAGEEMDGRGVPLLRLVLASAALVIIWVDPSGPDRYLRLAYATLALYTLYSVAVYVASAMSRTLPTRAELWIDAAWHTLLVSLSGGANSLFFLFYVFDILVASFRRGAIEGLRVTLALTVLFTSVGYYTFASADAFALNRFLSRVVFLLVLGYMIARWGGAAHRLRRRLALLTEVTVLSNPRFGVHQTWRSALEKLRDFYDAEECLLVIADGADRAHWLYHTRRGAPPGHNPQRCALEMAAVLLKPPCSLAMLVERRRVFRKRAPSVYIQDVLTARTLRELPEPARVVMSALDADSIITVPFRYHHDATARLYVTAAHGRFDASDLDFLSHVMYATLRVTDHVRHVDRLASDAAEHERSRLARGIHDTVIQPYIGLQLGLGSVLHRLREGDGQIETDVARLLAVLDAEVDRLRHYVADLKGTPELRTALVPAITRFARRFAEVDRDRRQR
jgi:signal transduction histidine kinase